jgi:hypothetical protein
MLSFLMISAKRLLFLFFLWYWSCRLQMKSDLSHEEDHLVLLLAVLTFPLKIISDFHISFSLRVLCLWRYIRNSSGSAYRMGWRGGGFLWARNEPFGFMKVRGFRAAISLSRNTPLNWIIYVFLLSPLVLHVQVILTSSFHHFTNFILSEQIDKVGIAQLVYQWATGWTIRDWFPSGVNFHRFYSVHTGSEAHLGEFAGGKAAWAWSWPFISVQCRDHEWSRYISTPPLNFMAQCLIN